MPSLNARLSFSSKGRGKTQVLNETNEPQWKHVMSNGLIFLLQQANRKDDQLCINPFQPAEGELCTHVHTWSWGFQLPGQETAKKYKTKTKNKGGDSAVTWLHRTRPGSPASYLLCCWAFSCDNAGSHGQGCKKHPQLPGKQKKNISLLCVKLYAKLRYYSKSNRLKKKWT